MSSKDAALYGHTHVIPAPLPAPPRDTSGYAFAEIKLPALTASKDAALYGFVDVLERTGPTLSWFDGTTTQQAVLRGWWDGASEQPATTLGWWDGSAIQPLA